jgi:hypothetical protein
MPQQPNRGDEIKSHLIQKIFLVDKVFQYFILPAQPMFFSNCVHPAGIGIAAAYGREFHRLISPE